MTSDFCCFFKLVTLAASQSQEQPAWLNSGKFQGDIGGHDEKSFNNLLQKLSDWSERRDKATDKDSGLHSAISDPRGLWLNGRVPYLIASEDPQLRKAVEDAIKDYHAYTCIRFVQRTTEPNYVEIVGNEDGCFSQDLGCIGCRGVAQKQKLNLGNGCKSKGIALHELMHVLGFWHEQQRLDRDAFITILFDNIIKKWQYAYEIAPTGQMKLLGKYDMDSVMHYPNGGFAIDGVQVTMKAKNSDRLKFGGEELTKEDISKIQSLYNCNTNPGVDAIESGSTYFVKAQATNYCLDVPNSSKEHVQLQQYECNGTPAQKFIFTKVSDQVYTITNVNSQLALEVYGPEMQQQGGQVVQWTSVVPNKALQQFYMQARNGKFHMTSVANGRIIWPDGKGKVRHWEVDGGQDWTLEKAQ